MCVRTADRRPPAVVTALPLGYHARPVHPQEEHVPGPADPRPRRVAAPAPGLLPRLSVMMFLQYAIQGAWLPLLFEFFQDHRGFRDAHVAWLGAAGAIGAVVSPFIAGQVADRYMNAERFMFVAHVVGAVVVWVFAEVTGFRPAGRLSFLYGVLYTPTLASATRSRSPTCRTATASSARPRVGDGRVD